MNNTTGHHNTAYGRGALSSNTSGTFNIGLGDLAGDLLTTGDNNIDIGNEGAADESNTIRIGNSTVHSAAFIAGINGVDKSSGNPVFIDGNGQLGTASAAGVGFVPGSLLFLTAGSPAPASGFTKIGTTVQNIKDLSGRPLSITLDVYKKN